MTTLYEVEVMRQQIAILRQALEKYADLDNWSYDSGTAYLDSSMAEDDDRELIVFSPEFTMNIPGYQIAKTALENADKLTSTELWRHPHE